MDSQMLAKHSIGLTDKTKFIMSANFQLKKYIFHDWLLCFKQIQHFFLNICAALLQTVFCFALTLAGKKLGLQHCNRKIWKIQHIEIKPGPKYFLKKVVFLFFN